MPWATARPSAKWRQGSWQLAQRKPVGDRRGLKNSVSPSATLAGSPDAGLPGSRTGAAGQGPSARIAARSDGVSGAPSVAAADVPASKAGSAIAAAAASRAPAAAASERRTAGPLAAHRLRMRGLPAGDRALELRVLRAGRKAQLVERLQVLLRLRDVAGHQVGLAHVFVRAAMLRVDRERLVVVQKGRVEVAGLAIRVAQPVVGVGVAVVLGAARDVGLEQRDRLREVLGLDLVDGLRVFRIG